MDFPITSRVPDRRAEANFFQCVAACALLIALNGCVVSTKYEWPAVDVPSGFRWNQNAPSTSAALVAPVSPGEIVQVSAEQPSTVGVAPTTVSLPVPCVSNAGQNGAWWKVFKDAKLDEIEQQAFNANQDVYAAMARVDEARALARVAKADFFPRITADPNFTRSAGSANTFAANGGIGGTAGLGSRFARTPRNDFLLPINASWELDVFGRIRHTYRASLERAEATVADYQGVLLTVSTDLATAYFQLRQLDLEAEVLARNKGLRAELLKLVESRFKLGAIDAIDVERTKADIAAIDASLADIKRRREQAANALAILSGTPASNFTLENMPLAGPPPAIPTGLPSALLERRPDVIESERLLAAACDEIAVARTAFLPRFALTSGGGFESQDLGTLLHGQSTFWNFITNMSAPLFGGGRNKAGLEAAKARYCQAAAEYKQHALIAFREVEDALVEIRFRNEQAAAIDLTITSAREVTRLTAKKYEAGQISNFEVVDAQRIQLDAEQQAAQLLGFRTLAAVRLIKALGGGWNAAESK